MGGFFEPVIRPKIFQTQVCTGMSAPAGPTQVHGHGVRCMLRPGLRDGLRHDLRHVLKPSRNPPIDPKSDER